MVGLIVRLVNYFAKQEFLFQKPRINVTIMWEILLPFLGFLIGTVAALTGIGGGVFIVPLLTLLFAFSPPNAAATSHTVIVFTALTGTLIYSRQKRISYRTGALFAVATTPGGILGVYLTTVMSARTLGLIFGFFMIIFVAIPISIDLGSVRLKRSSSSGDGKADVNSKRVPFGSSQKVLLGAILSFFGGIASGLLGIGGGVLIVPILTLVVDMPIHFARAHVHHGLHLNVRSGGTLLCKPDKLRVHAAARTRDCSRRSDGSLPLQENFREKPSPNLRLGHSHRGHSNDTKIHLSDLRQRWVSRFRLFGTRGSSITVS